MSTATPWSRCSTIRRCTNSIEPDVEAAGRLAGDQQLVLAPELPGQDDLLLVAAGQRADRGVHRGGADVELLVTRSAALAGDRGQVEVEAGGERRLVVTRRAPCCRPPRSRRSARLPAGPRARRRTRRAAAGRGVAWVRSRPFSVDLAGHRGPQPHQRLAQLGLPVALHAGHAQDLARPDLEGDRRSPRPGPSRRPRSGPATSRTTLAGLGRLLAHPQLHVPADHQRGELVLGGRRRPLADHRAAAQHGDRCRRWPGLP